MRHWMTTTGLAVVLAATGMAGADAASHNNDEMKQTSASAYCADLFTKADSDGNGKISREEARNSMGDEFAAIDADGNGRITRAEYVECLNAAAESVHAMASDASEETFQSMDANSDSSVDVEEYSENAPESASQSESDMQASFDALDSNRDGFVGAAEWKNPIVYRSADLPIYDRFTSADTDGNGELSQEEFNAAHEGEFESAQNAQASDEGVPTLVYYRYVWVPTDEADGSTGSNATEMSTEEMSDEQTTAQNDTGMMAQDAEGRPEGQATLQDTYGAYDYADEANVTRVNDLLGENIQNENGEVIGEIDDIAMKGDQLHAVVGVGGFLGIGDRESLVPFSRLTVNADDEVTTDMSQAEIEALPEFDYDQAEVRILSGDRAIDQSAQ